MNSSWVETQEIITATFRQPEADRERFVRAHCRDPVLRESIAALVTSTGGAAPPPDATQPDLPTGSRVGPYVIQRRLGRGGMGEVFLGRDPRLDRSVALKCLLTSARDTGDLRARVIHEARAAARIAHAHVAAIYDVVEHDGRPFIVMEYVEGESLWTLLKRESLAPARVVAIGRQIAAALAAAHAGGIIHRDLKPANIQVTLDGSIKILDFGIAKALASLTTGIGVTATETRGGQPGTPAYMSPEQLLGRTVDERSDLFSLSVILFEMATGRRLFPENDPLSVLMAVMGTLPRADDIDPGIPSPLADVIAKGLAADAAHRFQSAVEVGAALDALREATSSRSVAAAVDPAPAPAVRHRAAVALAVSVPFVVWALGRLSSAAFNNTFGRADEFAAEPALQHLVWGGKSLVAPAVYAAVALTAWWAAKFMLRLLALVPGAAGGIDRVALRLEALAARLNLNDPVVLPQALAALGAATLALVAWRFNLLIRSWGTNISVAAGDFLWRLGPANEDEKVLYRAVLTVLFLAFGIGLARVVGIRARHRTRQGAGAVVALALIVAALLLLNEAPYRILWQNDARRVDYQGQRCYIVGASAAQWLLFCPDNVPPRNRVVGRPDPAVRPSGIVESVFTTAR